MKKGNWSGVEPMRKSTLRVRQYYELLKDCEQVLIGAKTILKSKTKKMKER